VDILKIKVLYWKNTEIVFGFLGPSDFIKIWTWNIRG